MGLRVKQHRHGITCCDAETAVAGPARQWPLTVRSRHDVRAPELSPQGQLVENGHGVALAACVAAAARLMAPWRCMCRALLRAHIPPPPSTHLSKSPFLRLRHASRTSTLRVSTQNESKSQLTAPFGRNQRHKLAPQLTCDEKAALPVTSAAAALAAWRLSNVAPTALPTGPASAFTSE